MANVINATSTGNGGLVSTGDDSGILNIQTNETTAITVDASQKVGIGTVSPVSKLDVTGQVTATGGFFKANGAPSLSAATAGEAMLAPDSGSGAILYGRGTNYDVAICQRSTGVALGVLAGTTNVYVPDGLLVGTTSALGSAKVTIKTPDSSGSLIPLTLAVGLVSDGFGGISFRNPNGAQGGVSINSTSVTYNTTSDYRLKEDVQPMTGALAKVAQLKPVTYKWKINGKDSEGFIAHELAEVCPQAVTGEKDALDEEGNPKHQGIDTSFLVATLTAAIQEQQATINALTARIVALEGQ